MTKQGSMKRGAIWLNRAVGMLVKIVAGGLVAVPTLAATEPPPVEAYAHQPMASNLTLSPDGKHVAFFAPVNGVQHLIVARLGAEGERPVVVPPGQFRFGSVEWVNEDRLIIGVVGTTMSSGPGRDIPLRVNRLLAIDRDGKNALLLFEHDIQRSFERFGGQILQFQDRENLVVVAPFGEKAPDVVSVNVNSGKFQRIARGIENVISYLPDPSGNVRLATRIVDRSQTTIFLFRERAGQAFREIKQVGLNDPGFAILGFGADPNKAYVASGHETDTLAVYEYDLLNQTFIRQVAHDPGFDITAPIVIDRRVVGVQYTKDMPTQIFFDEQLEKFRSGIDAALPDSVETVVDRTRDGRYTLIASFHPQEPVTYRLYDRERNELSFFADTFPNIPAEAIGRREPVSFSARDGLTIPGYLTLPAGTERRGLPFVVLPHGGPLARDSQTFDTLSQFLVSRGYGVLQPNFRGSTGYGQKFGAAGLNQFGTKMIEDIVDGARWAVAQGYADPERMCILGWSYGGYAALMSSIREPELFKCAVATAPITNMPRLWRELRFSTSFTGINRALYFGDDPDGLREISPVHQVSRLKAPVLLVHGSLDAQAFPEHSADMAEALAQAGLPHEFIKIDGMDHSPNRTEQMVTVLSAWERFLAKHIGTQP